MSEGKTENPTTVERASDHDLVVTRTFNAPARLVFEAWTTPALFKRWWVPKSLGMSMITCEMDIRTGGSYRLVFVFDNEPSKPMEFFGKYLEVTPHSRIVWTNDEGESSNVTTVTFDERDGKTLMTMRDRVPTKEALDEAIASGSTSGNDETFSQLAELLGELAKDASPPR